MTNFGQINRLVNRDFATLESMKVCVNARLEKAINGQLLYPSPIYQNKIRIYAHLKRVIDVESANKKRAIDLERQRKEDEYQEMLMRDLRMRHSENVRKQTEQQQVAQ